PPPPSTTCGRRRSRISRQANGAFAARASARRRAMLGSRGKPQTRKASNSKPASGTSRASSRSGDPAKLTRTPRSRSASATAIDGATWPPVPPAAIRQRNVPLCSMPAADVKENPGGGERGNEARAAIGDERQRDPRQRRDAEHRGEVDRRLGADEDGEPRGEHLAERVAAGEGDPQAGPGEGRVG